MFSSNIDKGGTTTTFLGDDVSVLPAIGASVMPGLVDPDLPSSSSIGILSNLSFVVYRFQRLLHRVVSTSVSTTYDGRIHSLSTTFAFTCHELFSPIRTVEPMGIFGNDL